MNKRTKEYRIIGLKVIYFQGYKIKLYFQIHMVQKEGSNSNLNIKQREMIYVSDDTFNMT